MQMLQQYIMTMWAQLVFSLIAWEKNERMNDICFSIIDPYPQH